MRRYEITETVQQALGQALRPVNGASVQINDLTGNALTLYTTETGGTTTANPTFSDAAGRIEAWTEAPDYDIVVSGAGLGPYTQYVRTTPHIDARSYGVRWDNSTDDTVKVQAALDAAAVDVPGVSGNDDAARIVQLPPGRGRIVGSLVVPANVWLRGHGPSGTYLYRPAGSGTDPVVTVSATGVQQCISDLGIINDDNDIDSLSLAGGTAGSILGDMRTVVRDVVVVGGRDGVVSHAVGGQGNELRLSRVTTQRTVRHGFWIDTTDAFLEGCTAAAAGYGGTEGEAFGFRIQGANSRVYGCKAFGQLGVSGSGFNIGGAGRHEVGVCEAQDCQGNGFDISSNDGSTVTGSVSDSCDNFGFKVDPVDLVVGCLVVDRSGGLYAHRAAYRGDNANVRGLRTRSVRKVANDSGATAASYVSGYLDIANRFGSQQIVFASTVTPDPWEGENVYVGTLTGPITVANPATTSDSSGYYPVGMKLAIQFMQDATGRAVTFGANYKLAGGTAVPTTASSVTLITFRYDGTYWREVSRATHT